MTESNDERRTEPFAAVLQKLQRGKTQRELGSAMQQLTEAVMETGKAGSLTLMIKVTKSKASGMVEVVDSTRLKLPEADRASSLFYVDDEHNLVRDDPRQGTLDLGPVRIVEDDVDASAVGE